MERAHVILVLGVTGEAELQQNLSARDVAKLSREMEGRVLEAVYLRAEVHPTPLVQQAQQHLGPALLHSVEYSGLVPLVPVEERSCRSHILPVNCTVVTWRVEKLWRSENFKSLPGEDVSTCLQHYLDSCHLAPSRCHDQGGPTILVQGFYIRTSKRGRIRVS